MDFNILFFEDDPTNSDNKLFASLVRRELGKYGAYLRIEATVPSFEQAIDEQVFKVIILDIMAVGGKGFKWTGTEEPVARTFTGIELLNRCRKGIYGDAYKKIKIFMRSARDEIDIQRTCIAAGATGFFRAGGGDWQLIEVLQDLAANHALEKH